jgi:hypothetical protein
MTRTTKQTKTVSEAGYSAIIYTVKQDGKKLGEVIVTKFDSGKTRITAKKGCNILADANCIARQFATVGLASAAL